MNPERIDAAREDVRAVFEAFTVTPDGSTFTARFHVRFMATGKVQAFERAGFPSVFDALAFFEERRESWKECMGWVEGVAHG